MIGLNSFKKGWDCVGLLCIPLREGWTMWDWSESLQARVGLCRIGLNSFKKGWDCVGLVRIPSERVWLV